jgi:hypothetical protein
LLDIPTSAATSRHHIPKDALKVLDAMIATWLTGCENGQDFLAGVSMPLPDAIVGVREMVRAGLLVMRKTPPDPDGGFSLTIEPTPDLLRLDLLHPSRPLPGLPGGEAWNPRPDIAA